MFEKNFLIILMALIILQMFQPFGERSIIIFSIIELGMITYLWFRIQKKRKPKEKDWTYNLDCNKKILQLMKIYRHDWQNHLQIILGYVSLKKYDQIPKYIAKVNQFAKQLSIMSSFNNTSLSVFLYMIPVNYPKLSYELEITEGAQILTKENSFDDLVLRSLKSLLDIFYETLEYNLTHNLIITLTSSNDKVIINIEFEGNTNKIYNKILAIEESLKETKVLFLIDLHNNDEFIMELNFPLDKN